MNAVTLIEVGAEADAWDQAIEAVNAWRGHAIQCFSQAEAAVSETLLALASVPRAGTTVRLRRLGGQKFEDLQAAIGDGGPFSAESGKAAAALAAFRQHESLRPFLSHGVAKVALDRNGQWVVILKVLAFRARQAERSSISYDRREAEAALAELKVAGKQLASALQSLRARIRD